MLPIYTILSLNANDNYYYLCLGWDLYCLFLWCVVAQALKKLAVLAELIIKTSYFLVIIMLVGRYYASAVGSDSSSAPIIETSEHLSSKYSSTPFIRSKLAEYIIDRPTLRLLTNFALLK